MNITMDKILAVILIFIAMMILMAAILAMGAVPEIFKQGEQLDQTLIQQHEDDSRANQSILIVNETNNSMNRMETHLMDFIKASENRSATGAAERKALLEKLDTNTGQNSKILASLENKSKDHATQSFEMRNLTNQVDSNLFRYGENSLKAFDEIRENQIKLLEMHKQILKGLNNTK